MPTPAGLKEDYEVLEEEEEEQEIEESAEQEQQGDLIDMMKSVNIKKKAPRPMVYKHEVVYFQDSKHNKMVAIKVRLLSATISNHIDLLLKMKGKQKCGFTMDWSSTLPPPLFLHCDLF